MMLMVFLLMLYERFAAGLVQPTSNRLQVGLVGLSYVFSHLTNHPNDASPV